MSAPTDLQTRIAARIVSHARQLNWQPGHHVTEGSLQPVLGTSRTPIRAAMALLASSGVLEQRPNRGYFLRDLPAATTEAEGGDGGDGGRAYLAIALDHLARRLPDVVSENELIRRYAVSRAQLRLALARIAAEGWVERRAGRGWAFRSLIDSMDAYRESYRFRQMLEPVAMRAPEFRVDGAVLERLRAQQVSILEDSSRSLGPVELFAINADFHESLAAMAGNRFVSQALSRMNQLRRLMEYGVPFDAARMRRVCEEHLSILAALAAGDVPEAARRLEVHLRGAAAEKLPQPDGADGRGPEAAPSHAAASVPTPHTTPQHASEDRT
jgi:DNA-binding GntR family transcriptional regulator